MTEVSFHFNAPDKMAYACRLLRKAVNSGAQVVVAGPPESLNRLDTLLWTFSPLDFIPHSFHDGSPALVAASPVLLGMPQHPLGATDQPSKANGVLVNLGDSVPHGFERFDRLVELVGLSDVDRSSARDRWKHYASRGYSITRHDVGQDPTTQSAP